MDCHVAPSLDSDLELRILEERLRLLSIQRELAALRCQRFTDMLEAALTQQQQQAQSECDGDWEGTASIGSARGEGPSWDTGFSARDYYGRPRCVSRRGSHKERALRRSRSRGSAHC